jgi:HAD superfamily hydrolase (TIGR01549 family)
MIDNIKWIFFDLGSTLIDETDAFKSQMKDTINGTSVSYDEFNNKVIECIKDGLHGYNEAVQFYSLDSKPWVHDKEVLYPQTKHILEELREHYHIGIIANQKEGLYDRLLKLYIAPYIDLVVGSGDVGIAKPDKKIFELALDTAECEPLNALMIGDSVKNDILPAKEMGIHTVLIKQGFNSQYSDSSNDVEADYIIKNLNQLLELLIK